MPDQKSSPVPPAGPGLLRVMPSELRRGDVIATEGVQVVDVVVPDEDGLGGWVPVVDVHGFTERRRVILDATCLVARTPAYSVAVDVDVSEVSVGDLVVHSPLLVTAARHYRAAPGTSEERAAAALTVQNAAGERWLYSASTSPVTIVRGCQVPPAGPVDGCQVPAHEALGMVLRAWVDAGTHPDYHRGHQRQLRRVWPVLAQALDLLASAGGR